MTANQELITYFYQSFQNKNYKAMQNCYADTAIFNDEVFVNLTSNEVKAMWEMFCVKGNVQLNFSNVLADEKNGSAEWTATYTFSKTNRKVINPVRANFVFSNNRILSHTDHFSFYRWASQALGIPGILLGWTSFMKTKIRKEARKNLMQYMKNTKLNLKQILLKC